MNKEQILKQAQKENKGADLVALETLKKGSMIASLVGIIVFAILTLIELFITEEFNPAYYIIINSFSGAKQIYNYIKLKKTMDLIAALIFIFGEIIIIALWILYLVRI